MTKQNLSLAKNGNLDPSCTGEEEYYIDWKKSASTEKLDEVEGE